MSPCASLVLIGQHLELASCFQGCGGGSPLCLLECVQSHQGGTNSNSLVLSNGIACLRAFWFDGDESSRQACLAAESSSSADRHGTAATDYELPSLAKSLMRGVVACDQCSGPRRRLVQALRNVNKCTSACVTEMAESEDMDGMINVFGGLVASTMLFFSFAPWNVMRMKSDFTQRNRNKTGVGPSIK